MRVVEFMGLPGAGKSAIADRIASANRWRRYEEVMPLPRGGYLVRIRHGIRLASIMLGRPSLIGWMLKASPLARSRALKAIDLACRYSYFGISEVPVVLDQGPLQALWSLFAVGGISKASVTGWISGLLSSQRPSIVVIVNTTPMVAVERVRRRVADGGNVTIFDEMDATECCRLFAASTEFFELAQVELTRLGVKTVLLDGLVDPSTNADRVMRQ